MKTRLGLTLICALFVISLSAQDYLTITGKVLDKKTRAPLGYAHVGIPEVGIGTTTSGDGSFIFKVPRRYTNSNLSVSYIGYSTFRKAINEISIPYTIYMEQVPSELIEVVVMGEAAVENIVRKAVNNIPQNYSTHPTTNLGFYRESRTDDSLNFVYLAEGVLQVYKSTYKKQKEGMISLVQGRKINLRNPLDTTFSSHFTSGHMAAHRFDFVKNRADFIDERFFPVYKYWVESMTVYNDRPVYIIGFDVEDGTGSIGTVEDRFADSDDGGVFDKIVKPFSKKKKARKSIKGRMKGRMYIDQESYAFLRAEVEITEEGLKKWSDYPWYAGNWDANRYVINYRQLGDKWFFSNAVREGKYGGGGTYNNEILITEINPERSKPLPYLDRLHRGSAFTRMTGEYDENFWQAYNVSPVSEGLAESLQQLATIRKAQEAFSAENRAQIEHQLDSLERLETLRIQEEILSQGGTEEDFEFEVRDVIDRKRKKRGFSRVKFYMGLGPHFVSTKPGLMSISYLTDGSEAAETIVSVENQVTNRDWEVVLPLDLDIYFTRHIFLRMGTSLEFGNSIYKERSIGLGAQFNLSKGRPVLFKVVAQHSNWRYARKIGQADNEFGKFKVGKKNFNANKINLYYGSRTHNLKLSGELAIELNPSQQLYFRGTVFMPFSRRQDVWFWERKEIFRKRENLEATDSRLIITRNGEPFTGRIAEEPSFSITVGLTFF